MAKLWLVQFEDGIWCPDLVKDMIIDDSMIADVVSLNLKEGFLELRTFINALPRLSEINSQRRFD
jgi:hypothetical protein